MSSDGQPGRTKDRELIDSLVVDLGHNSLVVHRALGKERAARECLEARLTTLEERVERLARLHDQVAADVAWMDRGES